MLYANAKTAKYYEAKIKEILSHSNTRLSMREQLKLREFLEDFLKTDLSNYYHRRKDES